MSESYDFEAHAYEIRQAIFVLLRQLAEVTGDPEEVVAFVEGLVEKMKAELAEGA